MGRIWTHDVPQVLRDAGIEVDLWPGWETRSRSTGGYEKIHAIGAHHTASNTTRDNDCGYMWDNPYNSARPIGACHLSRTGLVTVGAAGATNTQGRGGPTVTSKGTTPLNQGNLYWYSIEAANAGTGQLWPRVQQDVYVEMCRVLCDLWDLDPLTDVLSHFEWTPGRKYDPAGQSRYANGGDLWDMPQFRADVASAPTPGPSTGDNDMTYVLKHQDTGAFHIANGVTRRYTTQPDTIIGAAVRAGSPLKDGFTGEDVTDSSQVTGVPGDFIEGFGQDFG